MRIALFCVSCLAAGVHAQNLGPLQSYQVVAPGYGVPGSAIGDLNHDGRPDLVAVDGAEAIVLLGDGLGGFQVAGQYPAGSLSYIVVLADIDRDGNLDAQVAGLFGSTLLRGDGVGGFVAAGSLSGMNRLVVGDVNRDGMPDLLTGMPSYLVVLPGNGNGGFGPGVNTPLAASIVNPEFAGDIDGDGNVDVVLFADTTWLAVLFGDGAGGFAPPVLLSTGSYPRIVAVGDLNHDGTLDLCFLKTQTAGAAVFLSQGPRAFAPAVNFPLPALASDVSIADMDGDGNADVVIGVPGQLLVFPGDGMGSLGSMRAFPAGRGGLLHLVDLDGDGWIDVVTEGTLTGEIGVLRNVTPTAPGLVAFGTGTPACEGTMGIGGNRTPNLGAADFKILVTNAPPSQLGYVAFGLGHTAGFDPFGLGMLVHLQSGSILAMSRLMSDASGVAAYPLPIPSDLALVGTMLAAQTFWMADAGAGDTCSIGLMELASSRGLRFTVQP